MKTVTRCNLKTARDFVALRKPFDCNNTMMGVNNDGYSWLGAYGQLPTPWRSDYDKATKASDFYAVYSYATPIAWFAKSVWYVPNVRYSVTTSRHQSAMNLVRDGSVWRIPADQRAYAYCGTKF